MLNIIQQMWSVHVYYSTEHRCDTAKYFGFLVQVQVELVGRTLTVGRLLITKNLY